MDVIHPTIIRFLDAWKVLDEEAYVGVFADRFHTQDPYGQTETIEGIRKHVAEIDGNWTDLDYRMTDAVTNGTKTAIAYTIEMTGQSNGWEGQRVVLNCLAIVEVVDDKITQWNEQFDTGVMRRARVKKAA
ncbi:nuclear transport factor 2 family protein [Brevundimonas staleyi]|uniref:Nuclear transport factor 2 family protein n=1 Tax=Brevundimonas staleyi TaxID=74326 RepID=A0ABW0FNB3_9CAUL